MKRAGDAISASEMSADMQCSRIWAARYRWESWPTPFAAHFATGTKIHKIIETYLTDAKLPEPSPLVDMVVNALPYLPAPRSHKSIELRDTFKIEGLPFLAIADWVGDDAQVKDWKTTKDAKRYGLLSKEQKLADPQTVLYSHRYMPRGGEFDHVYLHKTRAVEQTYENKPDSKARLTPLTVNSPQYLSAGEIDTAVTLMLPRAEKLFQLRNRHARIDPLSLPLPENVDAYDSPCKAYGGCPHVSRCFPQGNFSSLGDVPEVTMSFSFKPIETTAAPVTFDPAPSKPVLPWQLPGTAAPVVPELPPPGPEPLEALPVVEHDLTTQAPLTLVDLDKLAGGGTVPVQEVSAASEQDERALAIGHHVLAILALLR